MDAIMELRSTSFKPKARTESIVIQELPDEVLVYDLERDKAHCLNHTAVMVWKRCDGKTKVEEIADRLTKESGLPISEELIWAALDQISNAHLLSEIIQRDKTKQIVTRRALLKRIGISAAIALPLVTTIVAPPALAQASCSGPCSGQPSCTSIGGPTCICVNLGGSNRVCQR